MKSEKKLATVIDFDEARRKRLQTTSRHYFAPDPDPSIGNDGSLAVTLMNGAVIGVEIGDITIEGIELRTNEAMARTLFMPGQFIGEQSPTIEIGIDLPLPDGDLRLLACCRLIQLEMLLPERVTFTLEFLAFAGAGKAVLSHFLRHYSSQQASKKQKDSDLRPGN